MNLLIVLSEEKQTFVLNMHFFLRRIERNEDSLSFNLFFFSIYFCTISIYTEYERIREEKKKKRIIDELLFFVDFSMPRCIRIYKAYTAFPSAILVVALAPALQNMSKKRTKKKCR
jgi:hypothetical protein